MYGSPVYISTPAGHSCSISLGMVIHHVSAQMTDGLLILVSIQRSRLGLALYLLFSPPGLAPTAASRLAGSRSCLSGSKCGGRGAGNAAGLWGWVAAEDTGPQEVLNSLQAGQRLYEDHVGGVVPEAGLMRRARHAQLEGLRQR